MEQWSYKRRYFPYYQCLRKIKELGLQLAIVEKVEQLGGNPRNDSCLDGRRDDVMWRDTKYLEEENNWV